MEKDNHTIQLDRPKVLLAQKGSWGRWAFYFVMMALGALGAFGCLLTAFQIPAEAFPLVLSGTLCCAFWLWRRGDTRKRWWSRTLLGWAVWLLFCVFLFDQALTGAVTTLNQMLSSYSAKLNYALPVLSIGGRAGPAAMQAGATVFWALLAFPFFWWLSRMLVRQRNHLEAFALTSVFLLLPMGFSILPAEWAFGAMLLFWGALLLTGPSLAGRESLTAKRYRAPGANAAGPSLLFVPLAVLLCMGLVYLAFPQEDYSRPKLAAQMRSSLEDGLRISLHSRQGQGSGNSRVELDKLGDRNYSGETMLRARFQWEGSQEQASRKEYLKSFVGSVYTGHSWEQLDGAAQQELLEIPLSPQGLPARYGQELYVSEIDASAGYQLSIENVGANPRCVYIPYGLDPAAEDLEQSGIALVDDGFAKSSHFFSGAKEYRLQGVPVSCGWGYFGRVGEYVASGGRYDPQEGGWSGWVLFTPDWSWSSVTGRFQSPTVTFQREKNARRDDSSNVWSQLTDSLEEQYMLFPPADWRDDFWEAGSAVQSRVSGEQWALLQAVESYTDFVYQYYTQLPGELAEYLNRYREAYGLFPSENGNRRNGAEYFGYQIADVFQNYYTYSLSPPRPESGQDFVEFFLDQSHEGYCVHFATAAVALLRSAGYPARYAEGYVVPSSQQGWVDVPDYNAHAWAEVYTAGMGWVPVEVTPASADAPAAYSDATVPEDQEEVEATPQPVEARPTLPPRRTQRGQAGETLAATAAPSSSPTPAPTAAPYGGGEDGGWAPAAGAAGASLALILLVLLAGRYWRVRSRRKALAGRDRNQAALKTYAYLLKLYKWEALCGCREEEPPRWKELAEKARFGPSVLSQEELDELVQEGRALAAKLRAQLPRFQKLRCWLEGLI